MPAAPPDTLLLRLDERVAALRQTRPELEVALTLRDVIIRTQLSSPRLPSVNAFPLPRQHVAARLQDGVPLLHDQPVELDTHFAAELFNRLLNGLAQREDAPAGTARFETLIATAANGSLDPERLFGEAFVGHADHLAQIAFGAGVAAELLAQVATDTVTPILHAYAARLGPFLEPLDQPAIWERGYCPMCGRWPLLAELRGPELVQWLRCGACGSGWHDQAPACPYCGTPHSQAALTLEGESGFHLAVCERCRGYLKVGTSFDPTPAELLGLDDVASLHLDLAATARGYQRPPGAGYRIELAMPDDEWIEELA